MVERSHHPGSIQLAAYVAGELTGPAAHRLELHVAGCPQCAEQLQAEATLEVALHEAADALRHVTAQPRIRSRFGSQALIHALGAVAAAASVLLTLGGTPLQIDVQASLTEVGEPMVGFGPATASTDGDLLACVPAIDDVACEEPTLVARAGAPGPAAWTELPEPFDPAVCWAEDDGTELVCTGESRSG